MRTILLVEDNEHIQLVNKEMLDKTGIYNVRVALNLAGARKMVAAFSPDLIVLDIMLPDGSGLEFLKELRAGSFASIPVLLLTALGTPKDVVKGLKSGGDDYLPKPYDYDVLLARIDALLSRAERIPETIIKSSLILKMHSDEAFVNEKNLMLSKKEFALLRIFTQNENRIMSAEHLYEQVWGQSMSGDSGALRSAICKLRRKIENSGFTIFYEQGKGYLFHKG